MWGRCGWRCPPPPPPLLIFPVFFSSGGSIHAGVNNWRPDGINHSAQILLNDRITVIWRLCVLWQPCQWDSVVDLYSSDAVKGTVEEYLPSAAFGKCALKRHIVLVITASLLCSSYVHAALFFFFMALGKLLFLLESSSRCLARLTKMETSWPLWKHGYQWSMTPNMAVTLYHL